MAIVQTVEAASGGRRMRVSSPATEQPIGDVTVTTPDEVRAAVARARVAQPAWEALGFDGRSRIMEAALKVFMSRRDEYMAVIMRETGRSRFETIMMEVFPA